MGTETFERTPTLANTGTLVSAKSSYGAGVSSGLRLQLQNSIASTHTVLAIESFYLSMRGFECILSSWE